MIYQNEVTAGKKALHKSKVISKIIIMLPHTIIQYKEIWQVLGNTPKDQ